MKSPIGRLLSKTPIEQMYSSGYSTVRWGHHNAIYRSALGQKLNHLLFFSLQTLCLWLDPELNIYSIKQTLLAHQAKSSSSAPLGCTANDIFFVWNGKPLDDQALLCDYIGKRNNNNSMIIVGYRNRGGCFLVSFSILCIIILSIIGSFCTCGLSLLIVPVLLPLLFVLPLFCL